jgi:1-acyl-sn-glycerol-3-phosphate acyltransferase
MVRATLVYGFVALFVLTVGPIGLAWSFLSGNTAGLFTLARTCIRAAGWLSGIRVKVHGKDRLSSGRAYLFLVKKEIMRIPVLSAILRRVNFVPVDRSDPMKARASIDQAAQLLQAGNSFFAFPEGTRSRDGSLAGFKKGVFVMAIKAGVPVVPVSIRNSRDIQPPGRFGIRPGLVEVMFHEPVQTSHMRMEDRDTLLQSTRESIAKGLE